jgi:hypothetical protein
MNKCNSSYKAQLRGIVMTNMNIYKMDPKNFKAANKPIPIAEIVDVTCVHALSVFLLVFILVFTCFPVPVFCVDLLG